jgi:TatD DNase family protein
MAARANQLESQLHLLKDRLSQGRAVAIGEIGLDTRTGLVEAEVQEAFFTAQLDLAHELELPVILHCVAAHGRMAQLLRARGKIEFGGMVHGFTGSWEIAQDYLSVGLSLSFGGLLTRSNSKKARDTAKRIPMERLLIESDSPDHPASGWQPEQSEPASLSLIIQSLAGLRGESAESIAQTTTDNATALFGLKSR